MQYTKIMGIDYGDKRIGIAFSDFLHLTAIAYKVYQNLSQDTSIDYLAKLAKENSVELIVVGYPLSLEGSENDRTKLTKEFAKMLEEKSGIKVILQDERLSSYEADEILKEAGLCWQERKEKLDMVAAEVILQDYLNRIKK